jgi:hypothetical protein
MDLEPFFADYNRIAREVGEQEYACGREHDLCCHDFFALSLVEAAWLHHVAGTLLDQPGRKGLAERVKNDSKGYICALSVDRQCILFSHRPIRCRVASISGIAAVNAKIGERLQILSQQLFVSLAGTLPEDASLSYPMPRVLSGAFVQDYFTAALRISRSPIFGEEGSTK